MLVLGIGTTGVSLLFLFLSRRDKMEVTCIEGHCIYRATETVCHHVVTATDIRDLGDVCCDDTPVSLLADSDLAVCGL